MLELKIIVKLLLVVSLCCGQSSLAQEVPLLAPEVLNQYPHDEQAFTQGLLWHDGFLYESTGLWGQSSLRRVDLESGVPDMTIALDEAYFAEGLERVGDRLIQLTWRAGRAFVYDFDTFERIDTYEYAGEGWGLCYDGRYLYMSDSTSRLSIREPGSFALVFRGAVTLEGRIIPAQLLNELECVGDHIYANAWEYRLHLPHRQVHRRRHCRHRRVRAFDRRRARRLSRGQRAQRHRLQRRDGNLLRYWEELAQAV